jgi:hypothetical protein
MSAFLSEKLFFGENTFANPKLHAPMIQEKERKNEKYFPAIRITAFKTFRAEH